MIIKELPNDEKPREKLVIQGPEFLSNSELIAILIRSGTKEKSALQLAGDILALGSEGLRFLGECSVEDICAVKGIGQAKACQLMAAVELGKRIAISPGIKKVNIKNSDDIAGLFMEKMRYHKKEHFSTLLLDTQGGIICTETAAIGDLNTAIVNPREVFSGAVRRSAAAIIFVHNHPSGDPKPSDADIATTERLVEAGNILGIRVLDHIIIGDGRYTSLHSEGLI